MLESATKLSEEREVTLDLQDKVVEVLEERIVGMVAARNDRLDVAILAVKDAIEAGNGLTNDQLNKWLAVLEQEKVRAGNLTKLIRD